MPLIEDPTELLNCRAILSRRSQWVITGSHWSESASTPFAGPADWSCRTAWAGNCHVEFIFEGSLEVKQTSDNMDRWKAEQGRGREKRKIRREKIREEKESQKKEDGKSRNTVFFQWFVAPEGRKVGWLKRRVRSQLARWEMKNCTPLWREAPFQVKMHKTH